MTGKSPLNAQDKPALVAEARTAIEFTFPAAIGKTYQIEDSPDLATSATVETDIAAASVTSRLRIPLDVRSPVAPTFLATADGKRANKPGSW